MPDDNLHERAAQHLLTKPELAVLSATLFELLDKQNDAVPAEGQAAEAFDVLVRDDTNLVLHKDVLSRHSAGVARTLPQFAAKFGARLLKMTEGERDPSTGVLMMLLLLRRHLPKSAGLGRLPEWHKEAVAGFTHEQVTLPYNSIFDRVSFGSNVVELESVLPTLDWAEQWRIHGTRKVLSLLYHWAPGSPSSLLRPLQQKLSAEVDQHEDPEETLLRRDTLQALNNILIRSADARTEVDPIHRRSRQLLSAVENYVLRPFAIKTRRRPRVAVCVSGQLRGYEKALQSWRRHLLPGIDASFFIHSWTKAGRSGAEPFRRFLPFEGANFQRVYREECLRLGFENFVKRYPNLFRRLSASNEVSQADLSRIYATEQVVLEDEGETRFKGWSNSRKMHYKLEQAQLLMEKSGGHYDLVMRIRPDKAIRLLAANWTQVATYACGRKLLLSDLPMGVNYGTLMIGDQFAVGSPESMRIYAGTYSDAVELQEAGFTGPNEFLRGHVSLARRCWLNGVQVERFPAKFGDLLEFAPLSNTEIEQALRGDADGRLDATDQALLAAVATDAAV